MQPIRNRLGLCRLCDYHVAVMGWPACLRRPGYAYGLDSLEMLHRCWRADHKAVRAVEEFRRGSRVTAIAEELGITPSKVRRWLRAAYSHGLPRRDKRTVPPALVGAVASAYQSGATIREVSERLKEDHGIGYGRKAVEQAVRSAGLSLRQRGRPRKEAYCACTIQGGCSCDGPPGVCSCGRRAGQDRGQRVPLR